MRRAIGVRMLIAMTIPLTGTQYEIEAGDYRATVTELEAACAASGSATPTLSPASTRMSSRRMVPASC